MRARSVLFLGQSMLKIAVPSVKCSISNLWVEGPKRKGKIVVTQEVAAHAHLGSILTALHLASFQVAQPLSPSRFQAIGPNISLVDFQYPCCTNILNRSIQLSSCGKMVCADCLVAYMQGDSDVCPGCRNHHELGVKMYSPPEFVVKLIGGLYVGCEAPTCQQYVQLQDLANHLASGC